MDEIIFKLDQFEGPMDLLLEIIRKNKYKITDIPISEICDQYLHYMDEAERMDLNLTSEFIVMASELLLIKSIILLPRTEEEVQHKKQELENALQIYQQAKAAAEDMRKLYEDYSGRFAKETDEIPPEKGFPLGLDPALLARAMQSMLNRMREQEARSTEKLITPLVTRKTVSVEKRIEFIVARLEIKHEATMFALLADCEDRAELIATFLGILELIKIHRILLLETPEDEFSPPNGQDDGLMLRFTMNPDYVPDENTESEFDHDESEDEDDDRDD